MVILQEKIFVLNFLYIHFHLLLLYIFTIQKYEDFN